MIDGIFDSAKDKLKADMEKHLLDQSQTPETNLRARKQLDAFTEFIENIYSETSRMVRQIKESVNHIDTRLTNMEKESERYKDCDYCEISGKTFFDKADYYVIQRVKVAMVIVGLIVAGIGWWMVDLNNKLVSIQNNQLEMMQEIRKLTERVVKNESILDYHIKDDEAFKARH